MIKPTLFSLGIASTILACGGSVAVGGPKDTAIQSVEDPLGTMPSGTLKLASKVDLLLMIDDSSSMKDKQELLKKSVPDLITRLVNPRCIDTSGAVVGNSANEACATGHMEFAPVHDLHIGIVSSSLGGRGSSTCESQNDGAHLLRRAADGSNVPDTAAGFLAFGTGGITDPAQLRADLTSLVAGVRDKGCGFEQQLESWYRFLIQPDPSSSVTKNAMTNRAELHGTDATILQQRHDFLRPDSLVAILMLTDEDDGSLDPMSVGGSGYAFMENDFPGSTVKRNSSLGTTAPRGSSICASSPGDPGCTSCAFDASCNNDDPICQALQNDPNCSILNGYYGANEDDLNVRFHHMKQRFGVDPRFPIRRYAHGLSSAKVPSRDGEHKPISVVRPGDPMPLLSQVTNDDKYVGTQDCDNPLFSKDLPTDPNADLCHLTPGPRSRDLVVFGVITGVPSTLLAAPSLGPTEWTAILGKDPLHYDESGIDPHMVQSITPRSGLPGPSSANDADPIHGRDWDTAGIDLQYACTFQLETPIDCSNAALLGGPPLPCDCSPGSTSPLCSAGAESALQLRGKAYPGIRQLEVAQALGSRATVSSLCPEHVAEVTPDDKRFAYRAAMAQLGDRMAQSLVPVN